MEMIVKAFNDGILEEEAQVSFEGTEEKVLEFAARYAPDYISVTAPGGERAEFGPKFVREISNPFIAALESRKKFHKFMDQFNQPVQGN